MRARSALLLTTAIAAAAAWGCGTSEESGDVGDNLSAKGLEVTVERVDTSVPVPASDVTGLSRPSAGSELVAARVRVCNEHGGATGPFDFGLETSEGDGRLKFPQRNYTDSFDNLRDGCDSGWVVFEVPRGSEPESLTYEFQDTGTAMDESENVDARLSWSVAGG